MPAPPAFLSPPPFRLWQACFASLVSQDYVNGTDQEEIRTGEAPGVEGSVAAGPRAARVRRLGWAGPHRSAGCGRASFCGPEIVRGRLGLPTYGHRPLKTYYEVLQWEARTEGNPPGNDRALAERSECQPAPGLLMCS